MNHSKKEEVLIFLKESKLNELADMIIYKKSLLKNLLRLLYSTDELIRWRAIETVGIYVNKLAAIRPEDARNVIRSLFWSINDESGGIGWSAPECIGEIIFRRPKDFQEFASIIMSFTDEEMLLRGVLWAAARIAQSDPELVSEYASELISYIKSPDPVVRGYTLKFLSVLGEKLNQAEYNFVLEDNTFIPIYENSILKKVTISEIAKTLF